MVQFQRGESAFELRNTSVLLSHSFTASSIRPSKLISSFIVNRWDLFQRVTHWSLIARNWPLNMKFLKEVVHLVGLLSSLYRTSFHALQYYHYLFTHSYELHNQMEAAFHEED